MDFEHLLEPYAERDEQGIAKRTVQGQIAWLLKKGFDRNIAQAAIAQVYFKLSAGKKFEADANGTAGHYLDRYLLETAIKLLGASLDAMVKAAGDQLEMTINKVLASNKPAESAQVVDEIAAPEIAQPKRTLWRRIRGK